MDVPISVMVGYDNLIFGKSFVPGGNDGIVDLKQQRNSAE
jgi:hypothetical protein